MEMYIFFDSFVAISRILKLTLLSYYSLNTLNWSLVEKTQLIDEKNVKCKITEHLHEKLYICAILFLFYNQFLLLF